MKHKRKIIVVSQGQCASVSITKHLQNKGLEAFHSHSFPCDGPNLGVPKLNPVTSWNFSGKNELWHSDGPLCCESIDNSSIVLFLHRHPSFTASSQNNLHHFLNMNSHDIPYIEEIMGLSLDKIINIFKKGGGDKNLTLSSQITGSAAKLYEKRVGKILDPLRIRQFIESWHKKTLINFDLISINYDAIPLYWDTVCGVLNIESDFKFKPTGRRAKKHIVSKFSDFNYEKYPAFNLIKGFAPD